ncbi:LacI family DNA-binding transcriptional regulator [Danxiaibacter flavus]|uniref:LacI family DNA-binding transcriptional regulator n=1 Tax=Danxiaibacter flavus TaxID=3049108 RepID=A0ABV3ZPE0_9BACT|nr:LacI family DNA-binding transcriptional regulator [Chitinophagaceae bacterium DXS]
MKKISIKDIASKAGVSVSTVSFVLNNKAKEMRISDEKVQIVKKIAAEAGYKPNLLAKSLRTGKTKTIGLMIDDISNNFFASIAKVIELEAKKLGYKVFYCSTENDPVRAKEILQLLEDAHVDGFIITPTEKLQTEIKRLLQINKKVVLLDRYFPDINATCIMVDSYKGAYDATSLLLKKGYKTIALVSNDLHMIQMQQRENGYRDALKAMKIKYDQKLVTRLHYIGGEEEDMVDRLVDFFERCPDADAVFFLNNSLGIVGLKALRKLEYKIGKDIAVISFDDNLVFALNTPAISVVSQPIQDIGTQAVELLIRSIEEGKSLPGKTILKSGKVIVRESF